MKKTIINSLHIHLPLELCEKIMTYYKPSTKCSRCNAMLCYNDGILAHKNYDSRMLFIISIINIYAKIVLKRVGIIESIINYLE